MRRLVARNASVNKVLADHGGVGCAICGGSITVVVVIAVTC